MKLTKRLLFSCMALICTLHGFSSNLFLPDQDSIIQITDDHIGVKNNMEKSTFSTKDSDPTSSVSDFSDFQPQDTSIITFTCTTYTNYGPFYMFFPSDVEILSCTSKIDNLSPVISGDTITWPAANSQWWSSASSSYDIEIKIFDNRGGSSTTMDVIYSHPSGSIRDTITLNSVSDKDLEMVSVSDLYPFVSEALSFPISYKNNGKKVTNYQVDIVIGNETDTVYKSTQTFSESLYAGELKSITLDKTYTPNSDDIGTYTFKAIISTTDDNDNSNDVYSDTSFVVYDEFTNNTPETALDYGTINSSDFSTILRKDADAWFKFTAEEDLSDIRFSVYYAGNANAYFYESITDANNNNQIPDGYIQKGAVKGANPIEGNGLYAGTYYAKVKLSSEKIKKANIKVAGTPNELYEVSTKIISAATGNQTNSYGIYLDGDYWSYTPKSGDDSLCYFLLSAGKHNFSVYSSYYNNSYDNVFTIDKSKQITIELDSTMWKSMYLIDEDSVYIKSHKEGYYKLDHDYYSRSIYADWYGWSTSYPLATSKIERGYLPGYELLTTEVNFSKDVSKYYLIFRVDTIAPSLDRAFASSTENEDDKVYLEFDRAVSITDSTGITVTVDGTTVGILGTEIDEYNQVVVTLDKGLKDAKTAKVSYSGGNINNLDSIAANSFSDVSILKDFDAPVVSYNFEEGDTLKSIEDLEIIFDEPVINSTYNIQWRSWDETTTMYWNNYYLSLIDTTNGSKVSVIRPYDVSINDNYTTFSLTPLSTLPDGNYNLIVGARFYDYQGNKFPGDTIGFVVALEEDVEISATNLSAEDVKIEVYPNPSSDYININSSVKGQAYLYNSVGTLCKQITINSESQKVNISDLSSGLYLLKLNNVTKRILINN